MTSLSRTVHGIRATVKTCDELFSREVLTKSKQYTSIPTTPCNIVQIA